VVNREPPPHEEIFVKAKVGETHKFSIPYENNLKNALVLGWEMDEHADLVTKSDRSEFSELASLQKALLEFAFKPSQSLFGKAVLTLRSKGAVVGRYPLVLVGFMGDPLFLGCLECRCRDRVYEVYTLKLGSRAGQEGFRLMMSSLMKKALSVSILKRVEDD
jgi:hypothetical protein